MSQGRKDWTPKPASGTPARGYSWPQFTEGHTLSLRHGAASPRVLNPLAEKIEASLRESAPWTNRPAFAGAVRALAFAEAELTLRRAWHDEHGLVDDDGKPLPGTERLERAESRAMKLRDSLGLTPRAYASLIATVAGSLGPGDPDQLEALRREGRAILHARDALLSGDGDGEPAA